MKQIQELLRVGDSFAAIEQIQHQGTPLEIAARYQALVADFYWKAKDLSAVIIIGRAGIDYCLGQALVPGAAPEVINQLKSAAKGLAYNIGSFTWPGWEEVGISPSAEDLAFGYECARLNLRLALELGKPADKVAMAHWLIGAHAMASREFDVATGAFELARDLLPPADGQTKTTQIMYAGYVALASLGLGLGNLPDPATSADFDQVITQLTALNTDNARFYISRLQAARRVFISPGN